MGEILKHAAILDGVTPRVDGSLTLRFITQEVTKPEIVTAMEYYQSFGYLVFKKNTVSIDDIPKGNASRDGKSPSQRLRARLYVYHQEKRIGAPEEFEQWYERQLEKLGQQYLEKLER